MASTSNEESKIMEHHYGATMVQEMSVDYNVRHPRYDKKENFQLAIFVSYVLTYI